MRDDRLKARRPLNFVLFVCWRPKEIRDDRLTSVKAPTLHHDALLTKARAKAHLRQLWFVVL